jgi:hypothetical protein
MALSDSLAIGWNTIVSALAILLIDAYIVWTTYSYRRLCAFDGPLWASLSQSWLAQNTFSGTLYATSLKSAENMVRIFSELTSCFAFGIVVS